MVDALHNLYTDWRRTNWKNSNREKWCTWETRWMGLAWCTVHRSKGTRASSIWATGSTSYDGSVPEKVWATAVDTQLITMIKVKQVNFANTKMPPDLLNTSAHWEVLSLYTVSRGQSQLLWEGSATCGNARWLIELPPYPPWFYKTWLAWWLIC